MQISEFHRVMVKQANLALWFHLISLNKQTQNVPAAETQTKFKGTQIKL